MKRIYTPVKKKTILIVDDDQVAIHIYGNEFQSDGFKVDVLGDANSAMQRLKKDPVSLMILDLSLPGTNPIEVLKKIRSEFDTPVLPIIVFANAYLGRVARAALEAGATKCVTKGESTPDETLKLVRELLALPPSPAVNATSEDLSITPGARSEIEIQQQFVAVFLTNAPEALAKLRAGSHIFARKTQEDLLQAELHEMHRHIRSLGGSAGLLGFVKIAQVANALEALLIELHAKPEKITPSVSRTIAQAIDTLASLFDRTTNPQTVELLPAKILIVDDEVISREMISSALAKAGLQAVSVEDPLAARRQLEQEHFDLIFLDVEMPGLSGLDLCVHVREMVTNQATPVVFVTAHSDFGSRAQSTLSGGNDFIAKPFLVVELALKSLTWLFKESSPLVSTTTAQKSISANGDPIESRAPLSVHEVVELTET